MIRATLLFTTISINFTDPFAVNFTLRPLEICNWHLLLGTEKIKNSRYSNHKHNLTENNEGGGQSTMDFRISNLGRNSVGKKYKKNGGAFALAFPHLPLPPSDACVSNHQTEDRTLSIHVARQEFY